MKAFKTNTIESTGDQLDILFRARYPVIYCVSFEEARVIELIRRISKERSAEVFIWSRTKGLVDSKGQAYEKSQNPDRVLSIIEEKTQTACYILKDFHPYLKDPLLVRQLRDLCQSLKISRKNIVLLSPSLHIPSELSKEIAVVDIPLPTRSEVETIYQNIPQAVGLKLPEDQLHLEQCVEAALGLTQEEIENVFAKSLVATGSIDIQEILSEKKQIVQKSGILEFIPVKKDFESVGGLQNLKDWLIRRKDGFSESARDINLPTPKGILLLGVPGCGKSLTAVCTGAAWQMPLLRLDMGKIFSGLVGSSEENMRSALKTAESVAPCILWIDEIEKGMSGSSGASDGGTSSRVFGSFLTWMQEKDKPVFVLATANDISGLPPEMLRKGRFDEIFFVDTPSAKERDLILDIHLKNRNWDIKGLDKNKFISLTENFSGAEIEAALIDARYDSFFRKSDLTMEMLEKSLKGTVPLFKTMRERIDAIREWARSRAVNASETIEGNLNSSESSVRALELEGRGK